MYLILYLACAGSTGEKAPPEETAGTEIGCVAADELPYDGDGFPSWWLPGAYDTTTSPGLDSDDENALVTPESGC